MINLDNFSSYFVANWKLNGNFKFIDDYIEQLKLPEDETKCIVICPTSIHLEYILHRNNNFYLGAQNVSQHLKGPFTGEISCNSLRELNIDFCIVGHSERRQNFKETNEDVNLKSNELIKNNCDRPIFNSFKTIEDFFNNFNYREKFYLKSKVTIDCDNLSNIQILTKINNHYNENRFKK